MARSLITLLASTTLFGGCCPEISVSPNDETDRPSWADDLGPRPTDMWGNDDDTDTPPPCPTYMVQDMGGESTEVSDELLIRGPQAGSAGFSADFEQPIAMWFDLSSRAPTDCGGFNVRGISWNLEVMGTRAELEVWEEMIRNPTDESGNPFWRGSDFYELTEGEGYVWLSTIQHPQYTVSVTGTEEHSVLIVNGGFHEWNDPNFEEIEFRGGEDWRRFVINIFLADRLPQADMMSMSAAISWETDGIVMRPLWTTVGMYLDPS